MSADGNGKSALAATHEDASSSHSHSNQSLDIEAVVCHPKQGAAAAGQTPAHHEPVNFYAPREIYEHIVEAGAAKGKQSINNMVTLGLLAGAYIGFGFSACMVAGGQMTTIQKNDPGLFNMLFGSFGFPVGLTLCVLAGAELFTSNIMYVTAAFAEKKCTWLGWIYVVAGSWIFNFAGALILMELVYAGEIFEGRSGFTIKLALAKTSHPFNVTVVKGILCNWLVCLGVWQANAAKDLFGKFIGIWLPVSAFVALGFEHCIANMFLIPLSMKLGSGISVGKFVARNLIPSTIGNIIGGAVFVGMFYAAAYGSWNWEAQLKHLYTKARNYISQRRDTNDSHVSGQKPSKAMLPV